MSDKQKHARAGAHEKTLALFVYGVLMPGEKLFNHISHLVVSYYDAEVAGYSMWLGQAGWYPVAKDGAASDTIRGYVLIIRADAAPIFDQIEGYPKLFIKKEVTTTRQTKCWMYVGNFLSTPARILSGDFKKFKNAVANSSVLGD